MTKARQRYVKMVREVLQAEKDTPKQPRCRCCGGELEADRCVTCHTYMPKQILPPEPQFARRGSRDPIRGFVEYMDESGLPQRACIHRW